MNKTFTKISLLITIGLLSILFSTDYTFAQNPGNALDFDGSNDYISVPDATALDITNQMTIELTTVVSNVSPGWSSSKQRIVFYNGSNFFLLYTKGGGSIFYNADADNAGTWDKGESSLITDQSSSMTEFDIYLVNDTKFDIVYEKSSNVIAVSTCTISGQTITCSNSESTFGDPSDSYAIARTPSDDRIYVVTQDAPELEVWSANSTGDASTVSGWTDEIGGAESNIDVVNGQVAIVPYQYSDEVLVIYQKDAGGTGSDGVYSREITDGGGAGSIDEIGNLGDVGDFSNPVRLADNDIRYILRKSTTGSAGDEMVEYKWDGWSWAIMATIDIETDQQQPSLVYDRIAGDLYAFSIDNGESPDQVERHKKTLGSRSFGDFDDLVEDIAFNDDGTKMYVLGSFPSDSVYQFSLSTAWSIATASYAKAFSVQSENSGPLAVTFKDDGTKMYVLGSSFDSFVYQYSLSTAWDVSTASYDSKFFSVETEGTGARDIAFKDDGTKMYVIDLNSDLIYQYSLSTAWDVSTLSYDAVSFSVTAEDGSPLGIAFKDDGTKMYILGLGNKYLYQYSLSTAWVVSSSSYDSKSLSFIYDITPKSVAFNGDGTKVYISGNQSDAAYQYSLSTAWDISTASFDGVWGTETVADGGEATDRSMPITQMHEPPYGSSRTDPRQLVWAYRVQNGANFDLKVGSIGSAPLPVELVSFIGKVKDQKVYLNWSTATEVDNYGFEVQRSIQIDKWDVLGFVEGHGNSNSPKEYNFIDSEVNSAGTYSYRLKQIDNDGSFEFSKTIKVNFNLPTSFELSQNYPNPFNPLTTISFKLPESGKVILKIYNIMGEEIKTLVEGYREAGIYTVNFDAEELASGMYLYRLRANGFTETKKMLFMK